MHPLRGATPVTWRYTRSERVQCLRIGCNAYGSGAPHNARIPQRRVCRPARITRRQEHEATRTPSTAGVEDAGGTAGPSCGARGQRRGLARQHTAISRAGVEAAGGTAGPGCGARGWRGLAGQHTDTPTDWRPPRGLRGLAGLRADTPSEARSADGGRAGRPRGGRRSVGATSPHTPRRHNKTARPQRGRAAVAVALGFEPRVAVTPHSISSAAPSAARTRYLTRTLYYTAPRTMQIDRARWEQGHTTPRGPTAPHDEGPSIGDD